MVTKVWIFFIFIGTSYAIFTHNFSLINKTIFDAPNQALKIMMTLFPLLTMWTGLMNIFKESGLLIKFTKLLHPLLSKIFPDLKKDQKALSYIASNIVANVFGLGSAATPFGLKAMSELQKINEDKTKASRSMITFLVLNTSGVTIIPTTVISLRLIYGSVEPAEIVITTLLATALASLFGLTMDRIVYTYLKRRGRYWI